MYFFFCLTPVLKNQNNKALQRAACARFKMNHTTSKFLIRELATWKCSQPSGKKNPNTFHTIPICSGSFLFCCLYFGCQTPLCGYRCINWHSDSARWLIIIASWPASLPAALSACHTFSRPACSVSFTAQLRKSKDDENDPSLLCTSQIFSCLCRSFRPRRCWNWLFSDSELSA